MAEQWVRLEDGGDGVAVIRLDRPPMNPMSTELAGQLGAVLDDLGGARAVVVWGGEKVFCAGADVKEMHAVLESGGNPGPEIVAHVRPVLDGLAGLPVPTIAAITGYALGGGLELALACDLRVAAENARLGFPEITLGIFPGAGGTQRLPRLIGPARAKRMIFGGKPVPAPEALAMGLVDALAAPAGTFAAALNEARALAAGATVGIALAKRAIDEGLGVSLAEGQDIENRLFPDAYATDDAKAGIRSFVEQGPGKAVFSGR